MRTVTARVEGAANIELPVPQLKPGRYEIEVEVEDVSETRSASVEVEDGVLLFVETDKPIYKPGQTVHIRLMTLDALLKPWQSAATIEVQDAKGIKVFKKEVATDDYGMVTVDLPLSTEPNLGVWKLTALAGDQKTQLDVRVEEYVLPKYEVNIDNRKVTGCLADEPIKWDRLRGILLRQTCGGRGGDRRLAVRRGVGGVRPIRRSHRRHGQLRASQR